MTEIAMWWHVVVIKELVELLKQGKIRIACNILDVKKQLKLGSWA